MRHRHYFKDVSHLSMIDVYRVVELFDVPAGALDHAAKKILCAGNRGDKDQIKDILEARDSLDRWLEMRKEDALLTDPVYAATFRSEDSADGYEVSGSPSPVIPESASVSDVAKTVTDALLDGVEKGVCAKISDDQRFDEPRMDVIGQNGNDGEHYDAIEQEEQRTFKAMADKLEVPPPVPRQSDKSKPKPQTVALPNTDAMVDPTGRPRWADVPSWVEWMAQDKKGVWKGFQCKPEARSGKWFSTKRHIELNSGEPMIGENWTHMLEQRP